jgi:hypothetical protein
MVTALAGGDGVAMVVVMGVGVRAVGAEEDGISFISSVDTLSYNKSR